MKYYWTGIFNTILLLTYYSRTSRKSTKSTNSPILKDPLSIRVTYGILYKSIQYILFRKLTDISLNIFFLNLVKNQ